MPLDVDVNAWLLQPRNIRLQQVQSILATLDHLVFASPPNVDEEPESTDTPVVMDVVMEQVKSMITRYTVSHANRASFLVPAVQHMAKTLEAIPPNSEKPTIPGAEKVMSPDQAFEASSAALFVSQESTSSSPRSPERSASGVGQQPTTESTTSQKQGVSKTSQKSTSKAATSSRQHARGAADEDGDSVVDDEETEQEDHVAPKVSKLETVQNTVRKQPSLYYIQSRSNNTQSSTHNSTQNSQLQQQHNQRVKELKFGDIQARFRETLQDSTGETDALTDDDVTTLSTMLLVDIFGKAGWANSQKFIKCVNNKAKSMKGGILHAMVEVEKLSTKYKEAGEDDIANLVTNWVHVANFEDHNKLNSHTLRIDFMLRRIAILETWDKLQSEEEQIRIAKYFDIPMGKSWKRKAKTAITDHLAKELGLKDKKQIAKRMYRWRPLALLVKAFGDGILPFLPRSIFARFIKLKASEDGPSKEDKLKIAIAALQQFPVFQHLCDYSLEKLLVPYQSNQPIYIPDKKQVEKSNLMLAIKDKKARQDWAVFLLHEDTDRIEEILSGDESEGENLDGDGDGDGDGDENEDENKEYEDGDEEDNEDQDEEDEEEEGNY